MRALELYDYAVIRVVPRVEREEFINAGVILSCQASGFLAAAIALDEARLLALDAHADLTPCAATCAPSSPSAPACPKAAPLPNCHTARAFTG